jgi:hypothetical protein
MYTAEYLQTLKSRTETERRDNPIQFTVNRYRDSILNQAMKGGKKYEIIDINETQIELVVEKLREIFIDVNIEINEYSNPVMEAIQKSIVIRW